MRRFAEKTQVPISRSRAEIDKILRGWGADGIQWSDDFRNDRVILRFVWTYQEREYVARFSILLPCEKELEPLAMDGRTGKVSPTKMELLKSQRGKKEHRLLLLWIKAAFNAIEAQIIYPEILFLPFFEGKDGHTVGEIAMERLPELLSGSATKLLPEMSGGKKP